MTQAFTVFLEGLWLLWKTQISEQEANVEQKQESVHIINTFLRNINLKLFREWSLLNVSLQAYVCVCVCVCVCVRAPRTPHGGLSDTSALEISSGGGSGLNSLPVRIRTRVRTLRSPAEDYKFNSLGIKHCWFYSALYYDNISCN